MPRLRDYFSGWNGPVPADIAGTLTQISKRPDVIRSIMSYGQPPASTAPTPFLASGTARTGQGPFGLVPGPLGDVSDLAYNDLTKRWPTLPETNARAQAGVMNRLSGQLSPETQAAIQDTAARFGVSSGMPGAMLSRYRTARDLGRATEDIQRAGLQDYGSLLGATRAMNVSPETQIAAKERDLALEAAPDPAQQASYAKSLFDQYLASLARGGGARSPGGGTGSDFSNLLRALTPRSPSGGTGSAVRPTVPTRGGEGWGAAWNDQGGYADTGNVPYGYGLDPMDNYDFGMTPEETHQLLFPEQYIDNSGYDYMQDLLGGGGYNQPLDLNFGGGLDYGLPEGAGDFAYDPFEEAWWY